MTDVMCHLQFHHFHGLYWDLHGLIFETTSSKRILRKNEGNNKSCRKTANFQTWSCLCFVQNSSKDAMDLARICPKFQWGAKLRDSYGTFCKVWVVFDQWNSHTELFYIQSKVEDFQIATGTQTVTGKWSPESEVDLKLDKHRLFL